MAGIMIGMQESGPTQATAMHDGEARKTLSWSLGLFGSPMPLWQLLPSSMGSRLFLVKSSLWLLPTL